MITFGYFSSYNLNQPPYNDVDLGDCWVASRDEMLYG